jgi:outer membrane lipopolysaccharide assembly protein LptE/RlpB
MAYALCARPGLLSFVLSPYSFHLIGGGILLNRIKIIGLILLGFVLVSSCGYRFSGQGGFPEGVEKIFIEVFENRTNKTGIERIVTNQVVFEFTRQRDQSIASGVENADATLKGVIRTIRTQTISRVGTEVASEREVVMTVDLRLIKEGGEVIWAVKGITDRQAYNVDENSKLATDQNENIAIARLSERMSERIFSRLTSDF